MAAKPAKTEGSGIASRVRSVRERLGWTREELAVESGVTWSAIAQIESGRRTNLRPSTLEALSHALGVSIDYLVRGAPPRPMLEHVAFPYGSEEQFRDTMGSFIAEGIERSEATLAVTTSANVELLRDFLARDARKVEFADASDWYSVPLAAVEAYRSFTEARLKRGARWVRIVGEPPWEGRSSAEVRLWTRYESLLNLVFSAYPVTVTCPYDEQSVAPEIVREAHQTHPTTVGKRGISKSPDYDDRNPLIYG